VRPSSAARPRDVHRIASWWRPVCRRWYVVSAASRAAASRSPSTARRARRSVYLEDLDPPENESPQGDKHGKDHIFVLHFEMTFELPPGDGRISGTKCC
jgi:hypothetical protein